MHGNFQAQAGLTLLEQTAGHYLVEVDTQLLSLAKAIESLAKQLEVTSLTVKQPTAEELVVNLYQEFEI